MKAFYGSRISEHLTKTRPEDFLVCHDVPIARAGWYDYAGDEIGHPGVGMCKVYRAPDEVFSQAALSSFEGKPLTDGHPPDGVTPADATMYVRGAVQNVRRGVGEQADLVLADLIVYDGALITQILDDAKRDVSAGYDCRYVARPDGKFDQVQIRGNHVAVVGTGRAGARVRIQDEQGGDPVPGLTSPADVQRAHDAAVSRRVTQALDEWEREGRLSVDAKCDEYKDVDGKFKGGFDGAVKYFECRGYSEEVAKKIAGKIAAEGGHDAATGGSRTVKDAVHARVRVKNGPMTRILTAVGLQHYAADEATTPEKLDEVLDTLAEERRDENAAVEEGAPAAQPTGDRRTKDEPETERQDDAVEKRLAAIEEMLRKHIEDAAKGGDGGKDKTPEEKVDDAILQMQDPEGDPSGEGSVTIDPERIDDASPDDVAGPVAPAGERPENPLTGDTAARVAALRAGRAMLAAIPDPAQRMKAADALIASVRGPAPSGHAQIAGAQRRRVQEGQPYGNPTRAPAPPTKRATDNADPGDLGRRIRDQYNPHYRAKDGGKTA